MYTYSEYHVVTAVFATAFACLSTTTEYVTLGLWLLTQQWLHEYMCVFCYRIPEASHLCYMKCPHFLPTLVKLMRPGTGQNSLMRRVTVSKKAVTSQATIAMYKPILKFPGHFAIDFFPNFLWLDYLISVNRHVTSADKDRRGSAASSLSAGLSRQMSEHLIMSCNERSSCVQACALLITQVHAHALFLVLHTYMYVWM